MLDFQRYQLEFTAHIRNPSLHPKPANVVEKRMAVYREAVFNNIFESVSVCFPVCQKAIGARAWRKLIREFVANYSANSPIFREIPQQFLQFINTKDDLPIYLQQLAHYEWVELAVSSQVTESPKLSVVTNLADETPVLAPAHMLLQYDFPVHKISTRFKPNSVEKTYLLVYRNAAYAVKFIELNPMTFQLLCLIDKKNMAGMQVLMRLADEVKDVDCDVILKYGLAIMAELANQEAIVGSVNTN